MVACLTTSTSVYACRHLSIKHYSGGEAMTLERSCGRGAVQEVMGGVNSLKSLALSASN
jgi:hypothetical protein